MAHDEIAAMAEVVLNLYSDSRSLESVLVEVLDRHLPDALGNERNRTYRSLKDLVQRDWYARKEEYMQKRYSSPTPSLPKRNLTRLVAGKLPPRRITGRDAASGKEVEDRLDDLDLSA
jgi:hypothetical protein